MNNTDKWWAYKLLCIIAYGSHDSISYPMKGYVHINTASICNWQKIPSNRFRGYLDVCVDNGMISDLKITKGFVMFKLELPFPYHSPE